MNDFEPDYTAYDNHHVFTMKQSDLLRCPFAIMVPEHYRPDGTCKCDDPEHRAMMIKEWEYTEQDFIDAGVTQA